MRAIMRLEELGKLKKCNDLIGNRSRNLPPYSTVPQPTILPHLFVLLCCFGFAADEKTKGSGPNGSKHYPNSISS
jgi:hypothetical protein